MICRKEILGKFNTLCLDKEAQYHFNDQYKSDYIKHLRALERIQDKEG